MVRLNEKLAGQHNYFCFWWRSIDICMKLRGNLLDPLKLVVQCKKGDHRTHLFILWRTWTTMQMSNTLIWYLRLNSDLFSSYRGHKATCFWPGPRDRYQHYFLMSVFESAVLLTCPWTMGGYLSEHSEKMQTARSPRLGPSCIEVDGANNWGTGFHVRFPGGLNKISDRQNKWKNASLTLNQLGRCLIQLQTLLQHHI